EWARPNNRQRRCPRKKPTQDDQCELRCGCWPLPPKFPFLVERELSLQDQVFRDDLRTRSNAVMSQVPRNSEHDCHEGTQTELQPNVNNTLPQLPQTVCARHGIFPDDRRRTASTARPPRMYRPLF